MQNSGINFGRSVCIAASLPPCKIYVIYLWHFSTLESFHDIFPIPCRAICLLRPYRFCWLFSPDLSLIMLHFLASCRLSCNRTKIAQWGGQCSLVSDPTLSPSCCQPRYLDIKIFCLLRPRVSNGHGQASSYNGTYLPDITLLIHICVNVILTWSHI